MSLIVRKYKNACHLGQLWFPFLFSRRQIYICKDRYDDFARTLHVQAVTDDGPCRCLCVTSEHSLSSIRAADLGPPPQKLPQEHLNQDQMRTCWSHEGYKLQPLCLLTKWCIAIWVIGSVYGAWVGYVKPWPPFARNQLGPSKHRVSGVEVHRISYHNVCHELSTSNTLYVYLLDQLIVRNEEKLGVHFFP